MKIYDNQIMYKVNNDISQKIFHLYSIYKEYDKVYNKSLYILNLMYKHKLTSIVSIKYKNFDI